MVVQYRMHNHRPSGLQAAAPAVEGPAALALPRALALPAAVAHPGAVAGGGGLFYSVAADLVMLTHLAFVIFVCLGALLVLRWHWVAWLHVPAALYGAAIELVGWICPLTPLENDLRRAAGQAGFEGGFIEHYVGRILYPERWDEIHVLLGVLVLTLNAFLYAWIIARFSRAKEAT